MSRVLMLATIAVVLFVPGSASGASPSPKQALSDAAHGTWSGDFGTVEFLADGTASFTIKQCGFAPGRPGYVEVFTDCEVDEPIQGRLRVTTGGYGVVQSDGTEYSFAAYVDGAELHVGVGVVSRLDRDRQGTIRLGGSERLVVGDGTCSYSSAFVEEPVENPCSFVERPDRTVLVFKAPNPFRGGKVAKNGLVYLPDQRLVVSPELLDRIYLQAVA